MTTIFLSYPYDALSQKFIHILGNELRQLGFKIIDPEFERFPYKSEYKYYELIKKSDLVVAFLRDINPNVMLELGYALGKGKKILLISLSDNKLPFYLSDINYVRGYHLDSDLIYEIIENIKNIKIFESKREKPRYDILSNKVDMNLIEQFLPYEFEEQIMLLFEKLHYNIQIPEKNLGYDFSINNYKDYHKTLVIIKKYNPNHKTSVSKIREFLGTLHYNKADCGIYITSSTFTTSSRDISEKSDIKIELWDIDYLINWIRNISI